jgi:hypothetical protein
MKHTLLFLAVLMVVPAFAHGQSACAQLGVNCSHPSVQQVPSSSNNNYHESPPPPTKRDHADDYLDYGYNSLRKYWRSGSLSDYQTAEDNFQEGLTYIPGYAPIEYGLCELEGRAENFDDAIYTCQIAAQNSRQFAKGRAMKKWLLETRIPWLTLKSHEKAYNNLVKKFDADCGAGDAANTLGNGIAAIIAPEQGATVDLRGPDLMTTVRRCQEEAKTLQVTATNLNHEITDWNAKK